MKKKLAIVTTHPIQYQVPLFKEISKFNKFKLDVYFASKQGLRSKYFDKDFKKKINWNINFTSGYKYFFSKKNNYSINSFFLSFENLKKNLFKKNYNAVLILGWNNILYIKSFILALIYNTKIILRVETNNKNQINFFKKILKNFVLRNFFKYINYFLYIGTFNKEFYLGLGVDKLKLYAAPYSVDNSFFANKKDLKVIVNERFKKKIILFVGKFIDRKNGKQFLNLAFLFKNQGEFKFLMVGEGCERKKYQDYVKKNKLENVKILGFKNQRELRNIYRSAFLLIVPSKYETWGLVINEAMASDLPVISSINCSASKDLIKNGNTGFLYNLKNINYVKKKIIILSKNKRRYLKLIKNIRIHIKKFTFAKTIYSLNKILNEEKI
jgi:glycosyltransferase involved in cell wall biosynthesis